MMYASQIIVVHLKLYNAVCQLYLNKTGKKFLKYHFISVYILF